ncbi:barstar family protein [Streptomyces sp. NBC_00576]|uniref:barstar family protein n=1 Tax=Streptomyces sp. NBC_00576 TaxID=2903665 RepID=UPI002E7FC1CB|nr:barstar family protein [Streptomyces sp. NBC_00576]WUB75866.1 barstar family protein [Streptomyces sp. NBC_00576]
MTDHPLAPVFAGSAPAGVLSWPAALPAELALEAAREAGWEAADLDLTGVSDKAALMTACATAMRFPDYFGSNWDALADCLGDLQGWPASRGRLLLVRNWQAYAAARPEEWNTLQEIFADAAASWRATETGLAVVMVLA